MSRDSARTCLFCDAALSDRSREHIFPLWLLRELNIHGVEISPTHFRSNGTVVSKRKHTLATLQEGRICAACNTGWMSALENKSKALLVPLFLGSRQVCELSWPERDTLAKWAAKTVLVLNSASNYIKNIPRCQYMQVRRADPSVPQGIAVFAQQHHGTRDFYWLQGATWAPPVVEGMTEEVFKGIAPRSFKVSLQFKKLLLLVAYWPDSGWFYTLWKGIHIPLWPHAGRCAFYDSSKPFPWADSHEALACFHATLNVTHESSLQVRP